MHSIVSPFAGQRHYILATDGAAEPTNPGPGGWGFVRQLVEADGSIISQRPFAGFGGHSSNVKMEMTAAIKGLSNLKHPDLPVFIMTDLELLVNAMTLWLEGWKARGWRNASKKPVANVDLWQQIDHLAQGKQIEWLWVKGHAGIALNEMADTLANNAATRVYAKAGMGLKDLHSRWFTGLDALPYEAA